MKSIVFVCLVASAVAFTCFNNASDTPTKETCADLTTTCHFGNYTRGGAMVYVQGCGDDTLCVGVNEAEQRKKRNVEVVMSCSAGENMVELTEGPNTLDCLPNYEPVDDTCSDDEKMRYCYNGVAWKKHEYEGVVAPVGYKTFACEQVVADWFLVTVSTTVGDLRSVVKMDGVEMTASFKVVANTALVVSCQFDGLDRPENADEAVTAAVEFTDCTMEDGKGKTPLLGALVEIKDDTGTLVAAEQDYITLPSITTAYTLTCPENYFASPLQQPLSYNVDEPAAWEPVSPDYSCVNPTTFMVPDVSDSFQEFWSEETAGNMLAVEDGVTDDVYLRCAEGYEAPTGDEVWLTNEYVMLTFVEGATEVAETAATAAKLTFGTSPTDWGTTPITACTKIVVDAVQCTVADLGADMKTYEGTAPATPLADPVDGGTKVIVKCEEPGFKLEGVPLMQYQCDGTTGKFGTVYATCEEYSACNIENCTGETCNSGSALFSLLCLVVPLLHMIAY